MSFEEIRERFCAPESTDDPEGIDLEESEDLEFEEYVEEWGSGENGTD